MTAEDQSFIENLNQAQDGPKRAGARAGFKSTVQKAGGSMRDLGNVPIDALHVRKGYNVRLLGKRHEKRVEAYVRSILANGYREDKAFTCSVEKEGGEEKIYLVSGHTRLEAIRRANEMGASITTVPVICVPEGTGEIELTLDLVLSNDGSPLSMYEQGIVNERLIKQGLSMTEIARRQGYTEGHVRNTLELRTAPIEIVQWLADDVIAETFALKMIREHGAHAVAVIRRGLEKAAQMGKTKVTDATVDGPRIPPKVGTAAVNALENFMSKIDSTMLDQLSNVQGGLDDETSVSIPVGLLRELLSASGEIEDFRKGLIEKEARAKDRLRLTQERDARREARIARKSAADARKKQRQNNVQADSREENVQKQTFSAAEVNPDGSSDGVPPTSEYNRDSSDIDELPNYDDMINQSLE